LELFGPSSWLQGFYLLALDCGAKMAKYLGETDRYEKYTALYEKGKNGRMKIFSTANIFITR
jgi:hypothetical protein